VADVTKADVKRAVLRQWQHSDGTPLTAEERGGERASLFEALRNLKYSRAMQDAVVGLRADVEHARYSLAEWRTTYNQAARIQAKHEADTSGARNANRSARRTRGRRGKR
jgi:hypothetical protein